jgi:hypothetical protein
MDTFSAAGSQTSACTPCSTAGVGQHVTAACTLTSDAALVLVASTLTVRGAAALAGAPASAYAVTQTISDLAAALTLAINASGVQVEVTSVTDLSTGAALYTAPGSRRRRLSGATVVVAFVAHVPVTVASQATVAAAVASAVAPGGAGASAFSASLLSSLATVATASGNVALAPGGVLAISGAALAAPAPLPGATSATGGSSSAAIGAGAGVAVLVLLASGLLVLRARQRRAAAAKVAPGDEPMEAAAAADAQSTGHLALRVPPPNGAASTFQAGPARSRPPICSASTTSSPWMPTTWPRCDGWSARRREGPGSVP